MYKIDKWTRGYVICSQILKSIWFFGRIVLSINTYTIVNIVCYFKTIHLPYDVLYIMWVLYEKVDSSSPGVAI